MQNYKKYGIPKAQLVIADVPYNLGNNMYGSNPMWEEIIKTERANLLERLHSIRITILICMNISISAARCSRKNQRKKGKAPCMIVFCSFQQIPTMLKAAEKHGFGNSIHITFCKNYSAQVLKANMRVVGATEHALILYRDKLPKFNNDGKMIFDWMPWEKDTDGKYPKIHPTQKPVCLLKKLIKIFTDEGDVVIDPCCGSGSTLRAAMELGRPSYGFEIDRNFYERARNEMLSENYGEVSMRAEDSVTGQRNIFDMLEGRE